MDKLTWQYHNVGWAITPAGRREYQLQGFHAFLFKNDLNQPLPHEGAIRSLTHSSLVPAQ